MLSVPPAPHAQQIWVRSGADWGGHTHHFSSSAFSRNDSSRKREGWMLCPQLSEEEKAQERVDAKALKIGRGDMAPRVWSEVDFETGIASVKEGKMKLLLNSK